MAKNKYDFIQEILANVRVTPAQKERILLLSIQELKKEESIVLEKLKQIESSYNKNDLLRRIEDSLNALKTERSTGRSASHDNKIIPEPNPKHMADFMSLFNQRDGLKYLTHDYDENSEFDIDKFLISANNVFNYYTQELNIPQSLWRIVKQFAFDSRQTEWTSISSDYKKPLTITVGWATKELREWSKKYKLHPIRNEEYERIINDFKKITRIESPNLEILINQVVEEIFKNEIKSFSFYKIDLAKADFYSHVGFLKKALEVIFEEIKKRSDSLSKKRIAIKYERSISDDGYFIRKIKIIHYKSYPEKELKLILEEWQNKGNMGKIQYNLNGYCHWSVETVIEGVSQRVNILKENHIAHYEPLDYEAEGFTHILTFYYK